MRLVEIERNL